MISKAHCSKSFASRVVVLILFCQQRNVLPIQVISTDILWRQMCLRGSQNVTFWRSLKSVMLATIKRFYVSLTSVMQIKRHKIRYLIVAQSITAQEKICFLSDTIKSNERRIDETFSHLCTPVLTCPLQFESKICSENANWFRGNEMSNLCHFFKLISEGFIVKAFNCNMNVFWSLMTGVNCLAVMPGNIVEMFPNIDYMCCNIDCL